MVFRRASLRRSPRLALIALLATVTALLAPACGSSSSPADSGTIASLKGSLVISAASSLQGAFTEMKTAFERAHQYVHVTVNFGASSTLAQQIMNGAPVDVFASADEANMTKVSDADLLAEGPTLFATNSLEIIVRRGNPSNITSIKDLARPGLIYVTCAPDVPIGKYAAQVLQKSDVTVRASSLEPDVKGIVTKVTTGEADAGIVYATDVTAAKGAADGVVLPTAVNVTAKYPIAILSTSSNTTAAQAWIAFVTGSEGQAILKSYGFGAA